MAKKIVVDKKMLERMTWKITMAELISKLVDYPLSKEHIHSDENGWDYFVTSKSLIPNHPLLLVHHSGPLTAIIPHKDYMQLENGEVYPLAYIANAYWSYGKYMGGNDVSAGVFWKPLEECDGIRNTEKISQYLHQQNNSIDPDDYRQNLFRAMKNRIKEELELEVDGFMSYNGENALLIANPKERDTVTCYLPAILLNDILYCPGEREWEEFANSFRFELGANNSQRRYVIPDNTRENLAELCRRRFRAFGVINRWHAVEQQPKISEEVKPVHRHIPRHPHHTQQPKHHGFSITGLVKRIMPKM